jgi:chromosome segregation ATPase
LQLQEKQTALADERTLQLTETQRAVKEFAGQKTTLVQQIRELGTQNSDLQTEVQAREGELARLRRELLKAQDLASKASVGPSEEDLERMEHLANENEHLKRKLTMLQLNQRSSQAIDQMEAKMAQKDRALEEAQQKIDQLETVG